MSTIAELLPQNRAQSINTEDSDSLVDTQSENQEFLEPTGPEYSNKRIILQRFTIYNSRGTMYIVGSNAKQSLFRIIEITTNPTNYESLAIIEDKSYFYTRKDLIELIEGLNESTEGGIHKITEAYGLIGFIRFTKGYYLSVITKCSQVAVLGGHFMYHVDDTKLIPLQFDYKRADKYSDEEKLLSIFKYLDLGKTFYFSYTYDITNSLQTNFLRNKLAAQNFSKKTNNPEAPNVSLSDYNGRFVWNNLLLKPVSSQTEIATYDWFQPIIHGFIDQANISIYGRKIYITIIARRSHHFAGARFLKRGVNSSGNVANEIETEQVVSDVLTSSFHDSKYGFYANPRYTSFVQHRGSIPLYWSQDLNRLPKPPIEINLLDPYFQSSALHFNNLFKRYGQPIVVMNLIKTKERTPRELKLNFQFENCVKYLSQFLPVDRKLQYYSFDMSKHSKKNLDVITPLQRIARKSIAQTGVFRNGVTLDSTKIQQGIIRTNCIDCLDRTNAAQFIIGKEALAHQLRSLGFLSEFKDLDYDSDIINILTEMFHDHGDTIAVQYGGSNLVNTMDSYRRINQWSSHTRDILNSIKRIYSNSFMDLIRQDSINLFLGNYVYDPNTLKLWEMQNDFYLHNSNQSQDLDKKLSYKNWFNQNYLGDHRVDSNGSDSQTRIRSLEPSAEHNDNWFNECYGQRNFQSFLEIFQYNMNSNVRYFPSSSKVTAKNFDYSPFHARKPFYKTKNDNHSNIAKNLFLNSQVNESNLTEERNRRFNSFGNDFDGTGSQTRLSTLLKQSTRSSSVLQTVLKQNNASKNGDGFFADPDTEGEIYVSLIKVSVADLEIYRNEFKSPFTRIVVADPCDTISVKIDDENVYNKATDSTDQTARGLFEHSLLNASDLQLYTQYVEGYCNQILLVAKDNYFV